MAMAMMTRTVVVVVIRQQGRVLLLLMPLLQRTGSGWQRWTRR